MGLDESLFGMLYRAFSSSSKAQKERDALTTGVALEGLSQRIGLLASAVAERRVEVLPAERGGAIRAPRVYLPAVFDLGQDQETSLRGLVLRAVLDAALLGLDLAPPRGASPLAEQLTALLLLPQACAAIDRDFPDFIGSAQELFSLALLRRPALSSIPKALHGVEGLLRVRLGLPRTAPELLRLLPEAQAFLARALAIEPRTPAELAHALSELAPGAGTTLLSPPLLFGAVGPFEEPSLCAAVEPQTSDKDGAPGHEKAMPVRERVEQVTIQEDELSENPIVHSFEKLHTVDEYRGGQKRADGDDELEEHSDALDEVDLRSVTRSNEKTRSVYRPDVVTDISMPDSQRATPDPKAIPYDEWDARKGVYLRNWCNVFVDTIRERPLDEVATAALTTALVRRRKEVEAVRRQLAQLRAARTWHKRQADGTDVDLDALVDRYAAVRGGATPSERIYETRRRHAPELSVLVLVDGSSSMESWVLGQRVHEVARDALLVLGEALDEHEVGLGVALFSSETRSRCRFQWIKSFAEPWRGVRRRLFTLSPEGYTRIGPALRHATHELAERPERRKLIILLSDGKATDYDAYEGRHGVGDVRKAVLEAEAKSVHVLALAIDRTARSHLPAMFGPGRFEVLSKPELLPQALSMRCAALLGS